jgi:O-antigen/teichoic acid export membrane protein
LEDTILRILIVSAIISLVIGMIMHPDHGWIEGTAILSAVVIVVSVGAGNDYVKEKQFRALYA